MVPLPALESSSQPGRTKGPWGARLSSRESWIGRGAVFFGATITGPRSRRRCAPSRAALGVLARAPLAVVRALRSPADDSAGSSASSTESPSSASASTHSSSASPSSYASCSYSSSSSSSPVSSSLASAICPGSSSRCARSTSRASRQASATAERLSRDLATASASDVLAEVPTRATISTNEMVVRKMTMIRIAATHTT